MRRSSYTVTAAACCVAASQHKRTVLHSTWLRSAEPDAQGRGLPSLREDIKTEPARLTMSNVTLNTATRWAYKLGFYELSGPD